MNMFMTSHDVFESVEALCDQHINCGISEAVAIANDALLLKGMATGFKPMHPHHPLVRWAATYNPSNLLFTLSFAELIANERAHRWPDREPHAAMQRHAHLLKLAKDKYPLNKPSSHDPFVLGMDLAKVDMYPSGNVYDDYRLFLNVKFAQWRKAGRPPTWTRAGIPNWYNPS